MHGKPVKIYAKNCKIKAITATIVRRGGREGKRGEKRIGKQSQVWPKANYKRFACRCGGGVGVAAAGKSRLSCAPSLSPFLFLPLFLPFSLAVQFVCVASRIRSRQGKSNGRKRQRKKKRKRQRRKKEGKKEKGSRRNSINIKNIVHKYLQFEFRLSPSLSLPPTPFPFGIVMHSACPTALRIIQLSVSAGRTSSQTG